jgi:hypothetical protein
VGARWPERVKAGRERMEVATLRITDATICGRMFD